MGDLYYYIIILCLHSKQGEQKEDNAEDSEGKEQIGDAAPAAVASRKGVGDKGKD